MFLVIAPSHIGKISTVLVIEQTQRYRCTYIAPGFLSRTISPRYRAKIGYMKRQLIALAMILAVGLQGSLTAFAAGIPVMQADCQTSAESQSVADKACCPSGAHTASCCSDACLAAATAAVSASPTSLIWHNRTAPVLQVGAPAFFSRGDSPLIRPPIL
jgi:hypothetical protein